MEALQVDEQITPITTIKRHRAVAGRVRHHPRTFEDSGGRSPLITKDLDLHPQPPTNTRSPTLNSKEPSQATLHCLAIDSASQHDCNRLDRKKCLHSQKNSPLARNDRSTRHSETSNDKACDMMYINLTATQKRVYLEKYYDVRSAKH